MPLVNPQLREAMLRALETAPPISVPQNGGPYEHVHIEGCTCANELQRAYCNCEWESEHEVYADIITDIADHFVHGLPGGGLSQRILANFPLKVLRDHCHSAVSLNTLSRTVEFVHQNLLVVYDGATVNVWPSQTWFSRTRWEGKSDEEQRWSLASNPK